VTCRVLFWKILIFAIYDDLCCLGFIVVTYYTVLYPQGIDYFQCSFPVCHHSMKVIASVPFSFYVMFELGGGMNIQSPMCQFNIWAFGLCMTACSFLVRCRPFIPLVTVHTLGMNGATKNILNHPWSVGQL